MKQRRKIKELNIWRFFILSLFHFLTFHPPAHLSSLIFQEGCECWESKNSVPDLGPPGVTLKGIMRSQQEQWPGSLAAQVQSPGLLRTCCVTGRPSPFSAPQLPHPLKYILPMSPCSLPDTVTAPIIPTATLRRRDQYLHRADGEIKAQGRQAGGLPVTWWSELRKTPLLP